jgi:predicted amidohydrolase YtcJ
MTSMRICAASRPLSRKDLDAAVPDHPVSVAHRGGHTNWYNSKAFELAGITRDAPDPHDGRFVRDAQGELQGLVAENARDVFAKVGKRPQYTPEQQRRRGQSAMAHMSKLLVASGLTTVHDAGADVDKLRAYQDTRSAVSSSIVLTSSSRARNLERRTRSCVTAASAPASATNFCASGR